MSDTENDRHAAVLEAIGLANGEKPATPPAEATIPPVEETQAAPAEDAEELEDDSASSDGTDTPAQPRKKPGVHQRIDELTREKYDAIRRADALAMQLALIEQERNAKAPPTPIAEGKPELASFETYEDYAEALTDWKLNERLKVMQAQQKENAVKQQFVERSVAFDTRVAEFEKEVPGGWAEAANAPIPTTPAMLEVIHTSDKGPWVAHYLAKHPQEAIAIAQMSPLATARALGKIEAQLSAPAPAPRVSPRTVSQAPPPPAALPSGASNVKKSLKDETIAEAAARIRAWEASH